MSSLKELPLTQERLKHLLHYNPDTGVFMWLSKPSRRINSGSIAGRIKPKKGYVEIGISGRIYLLIGWHGFTSMELGLKSKLTTLMAFVTITGLRI